MADIMIPKSIPAQPNRQHANPEAAQIVADFWEEMRIRNPRLWEKQQAKHARYDQHISESSELNRQRVEAFLAQKRQREHADLYAQLDIQPGATKRDVKNAYRRKARRMHPDVGGNEAAFVQLQEAYHKLLKIAPKE